MISLKNSSAEIICLETPKALAVSVSIDMLKKAVDIYSLACFERKHVFFGERICMSEEIGGCVFLF